MTDTRRPFADFATRAPRILMKPARALCCGFVRLVSMIVAPVVWPRAWRRRARASTPEIEHARAVLSWAGDKPSPARCRALRALASATLQHGEPKDALALLDAAISTAALIKDRIEEASALAESGFLAGNLGHFARAEAQFRRAIALVSVTGPLDLRATLHHNLAIALHEQRKNAAEAERHAVAALELLSQAQIGEHHNSSPEPKDI